MAKPEASVALGPVRLARFGSGIFKLAGTGYRDFVELAVIDASKPVIWIDPNPIEANGGIEISSSLRLRLKPGAREVAFLDRVYKMRPKTGVLSSDVPSMRSVPLYQLAGAAELVRRMAHGTGSAGEFQLSAPARPVLMAGQAVQSEQYEIASAFPAVGFEGTPALPETQVAQDFAPGSLDRFFRPRPRGPVADDGLSTMQTFASEPNGFVSQIANPPVLRGSKYPVLQQHGGLIARSFGGPTADGPKMTGEAAHVTPPISSVHPSFSTGLATCQPVQQDRFFRVRPNATADRDLPELHQLAATEKVLSSSPSVCSLRRTTLSFEPAVCDRMLRMGPRSGVMSANLEDLSPSMESEQLLSQPATPQIAGLGDFAPSLVTRMFRMRPRAGVDSTTAVTFPVALDPATTGQGGIVKPESRPEGLTAEVLLVDRLYRDKPRAAADNSDRRVSIPALAAVSAAQPTVIGSHSHSAGDFAPPIVSRMFKGRPRVGVNSERAATCSSIDPSFLPLQATPATLSMDLGSCRPPQVLRLVRIRPKMGVDSATSSIGNGITALPFPPQQPEFIDDWWDVVTGAKPAFMNRMFRMRFKNPAQDTDTLSQQIRTKHLPAADPEPVIASLPTSSVSAAPSFLDRLYRMRPKSGKATPPSANAIPCIALEPRSSSGVPSAVLQAVSKQWKATPLSMKAIAATAPLLLILALFPLGIPSQATADPLRKAIVHRAAIEHGDDFVGELVHWQGVEKWKRTMSSGVQPVGLGLFKPSLEMRNYVVEFSAQIQKGGVGVVVRAADERNYQAVRLVTLKPGPLPTVAILRYAVIDGKETNRQQTILPMTVAADTVYRISLDVNDQSFTLMVQGKVVDFWSEERLKTGGAGFYGAKGEKSWVHNLRMSHQNDAIGKLFATLQNVQASNGSQVDDESEEP